MNDEIKISDEAREAAEIFFDTHPDSPRWYSEVMDLASRFDSFAKARTEYACLNWRHRDAKLQEMLKQRDAEIRELRKDYNELIMAVARKFENETRHQTALRYINQAEQSSGECGTAMSKETKGAK